MTKQLSIPSTLDSVEFFLYDSAGKEEFADIVEAHVMYTSFSDESLWQLVNQNFSKIINSFVFTDSEFWNYHYFIKSTIRPKF